MASEYIILGEQLLSEFLNGIKEELVAYMISENRNATGKSVASLQVSVSPTQGQLTGASWIEYTFRGRGPGGIPPINALIDWCNARGLPRGMAWGIAKKIAEGGTKLWQQRRNVLNEIITQEKIDSLTENLLVTFKAQIDSEIRLAIAA